MSIDTLQRKNNEAAVANLQKDREVIVRYLRSYGEQLTLKDLLIVLDGTIQDIIEDEKYRKN